MCTKCWWLEANNFTGGSLCTIQCTPRGYKDVSWYQRYLLVGLTEERCGRICRFLPHLPASQNWTSEAHRITAGDTTARMEMGPGHHGLCSGTAPNTERVWLHMGSSRQVDQIGTLHTCEDHLFYSIVCPIVHLWHCVITWSTGVYHIR